MDVKVQTTDGDEAEGQGQEVHRTFVTLEGFPRKKLLSSSDAEKRFKRAVLEASAELCHDFHTTYLDKVVKGNLGQEMLDIRHPANSYETLKKGFLFYLNGSGKYLILREHLREAVLGLLHQKSLTNNINGFKTRQQYQSFLHESYSFMLDELNDALHSTAFDESPGHKILKCVPNDKQKDSRTARRLKEVLLFAQEAFAQGDFENAHRLHTERIARSGDSDECWIDFALMWLSRGDDRLAEIAIREALTKNPMNLVGLLLAGLIAGKHRDERGISYLQTLLKHRPLCPELHVLIATVYSYLGNEITAESYYDTARKIHTTLTIPKTEARKSLEQDDDLEAGGKGKARGSQGSSGSGKGKRKSETSETGKGKKRGSTGSEKSNKKSVSGDATSQENDKKKTGRQTSKGGKKSIIGAASEGDDSGSKSTSQKPDQEKKGSVTEGEEGGDRTSLNSGETEIKITKTNVGLTKPPVLSNCIFVTWNVTKKPVEKLQAPEFGHSHGPHHGLIAGGGRTAQEIPHHFNMVLETEKQKKNSSASSDGLTHRELKHRHRHHKKSHGIDPHSYSIFEGDYYKNPEYHDHDHPHGGSKVTESIPVGQEHTEIVIQRTSTDDQTVELSGADFAEAIEPPVYSQRFGSELLWAAHLLLKLRQFEYLDIILAKEISSRPERSLEYLYLRAVSLHLRGRDAEALEVIKEALDRNPKHTTFWILKGHAQYSLRDKEAALESYERAMILPHGKESLHLAYIRFGTLCMEKGDAPLAKRVFLKRVEATPSPYLWIAIGNTAFQLGELEDALHAFSEANKLDSTNPVIWAHLSLVSLAQGNRNLAEQSYKWAIRFGLKKGKLMNDIKELHQKLGFGNAAFPKLPHCIPHEVFVQRLGRETPIELYAETLKFAHLKQQRNQFENRDSEEELIKKLHKKDADRIVVEPVEEELEIPVSVASLPQQHVAKRVPSFSLAKYSATSIRSKRSAGGKKHKGHKSRGSMSGPSGATEKRKHNKQHRI